MKSLSDVNSKLPNLKFQEPHKFLGKSTFESIQSGVFLVFMMKLNQEFYFMKISLKILIL